MTQSITTDGRVLVGANGDAYSAPAMTAPPTDIDNPGAPWTKLGLISDDGATWTPPEVETEELHSWQHLYPERIVDVTMSTSLSFGLMEWDRDSIPFALGGGTFEDDIANGLVIYHPPAPGEADRRALFLKVLDDPIKVGIYYPQGRVIEREETTFKKDEAALLGITFGMEAVLDLDPYQLIFDAAAFPDVPIAPTGATAGVPGSFTPAGAAAPANLTALQTASPAVVASPTTAWTVGQHVVLGDNSHAHWSSSAWVTGNA